MPHCHRVTYADCTVGNHVYYARYLEFLEAARGAFFKELDFPFSRLEELDVVLPVVRAELDFRAAARYDDLLEVTVKLESLGRVKLSFTYLLRKEDGTVVLEGRTAHGVTTHGDKPRRLPEALQAALQRVAPQVPAVD